MNLREIIIQLKCKLSFQVSYEHFGNHFWRDHLQFSYCYWAQPIEAVKNWLNNWLTLELNQNIDGFFGGSAVAGSKKGALWSALTKFVAPTANRTRWTKYHCGPNGIRKFGQIQRTNKL